jgi:dTMP kinase
MERGKFITVEGIEGVGKSTNIDFIAESLRKHSITVVTTREPGGTKVAEQLREILLQSEQGTLPDTCELLLMFAARASHLHDVILPGLERGQWIVCDRFTDATYAYQGAGRGISEDRIADLEKLVQGTFTPDLTVLLDAPFEATVGRRLGRGLTDRFEKEEAEFFRRVRERYLEIAAGSPKRIKLIDASRDIDTVQEKLLEIVENFINE